MHACLHTNQVVCRQLAWISGRKHRGRCRVDAEKTRPCGGLAYNGMGTKRARCRPARGEEAMVAIVSTTAYLGLEARAIEVQCQIAPGIDRKSTRLNSSH